MVFFYGNNKPSWWYFYRIDDNWNNLYIKGNFKKDNDNKITFDDNIYKDEFTGYMISDMLDDLF